MWIWLGFRRQQNRGNGAVVVRRDRSLGGKEVVVGVEKDKWEHRNELTPLSPIPSGRELVGKNRPRRGKAHSGPEELPEWWPVAKEEEGMTEDGTKRGAMQREVDRLVREITDNRVNGKDFTFNDLIQLRETCKDYGVKAFFDTSNVRDSLYRAAVGFVLDTCSRTVQSIENVQINGEEPRVFITGLSANIGLNKFRAATIIQAAVAARTRAGFLQAWAMEVQNNHSDAIDELAKICRIHTIFPPEEDSAEMEMVASGLSKSIKIDEREHLLSMFRSVCREVDCRSAAEALGLNPNRRLL